MIHHKLPKIPPSIDTQRGNHHEDTVVQPKKKKKKRRMSFFFKGFGSSRRKQKQRPPSTTSTASATIDPSSSDVRFETQPNGSDSDYDDALSSSEASILSAFEEMEQIGSDYQGWERQERKFEIRDEILDRLSEGKSEAFVEMLRHHEEAARQRKRKKYGRKLTEKGSPRGSHTKIMDASAGTSESMPTDTGLLDEVRRFLLFEGYHSGQAFALIILSSIAGLAVYEMMYYSVLEMIGLSAPYVNIDQFHALLIVFGLVGMRTTGYCWRWLLEDSYECVKFELHNRQRLGYWDARLMNYLYRSRKTLVSCLNILAFYSAYIGISYFYTKVMNVLYWGPLLVWFEEIKMEAASTEEAVSALKELSPVPNFCHGAVQTLVSNPISRFVGSRLCMTDDWNEFAVAYNLVFTLVAAAVYYNLVGSSMMPLLI
jgi:hypothetical protein